MNTSGLARHYEVLAPRDRLALMIAAVGRGDDAEAARLERAAPRLTYQAAHHGRLSEAILVLVLMHQIAMPDLDVSFSQASAGTAVADSMPKEEAYLFLQRTWNYARLMAYTMLTHEVAWSRFCAELPMEPGALLQFVPGWETVTRTTEVARGVAITREEAQALLQSQADAKAPEGCQLEVGVLTVDDVLKQYREIVDRWAPGWR